MEVWKDIYFIENGIEYDYRGLYQVSNQGRIKSLERKIIRKDGKSLPIKERILKPEKTKKGYNLVSLQKNGNRKIFSVHRLVTHMFCSGYFEGAEVDHINTIKDDNRAENLRWVTSKENSNNKLSKKHYSISRKGKSRPFSKLIERWKDETLLDIKYCFEYKEMGFHTSAICACCNGKRKSHKGYKFKYHKDLD